MNCLNRIAWSATAVLSLSGWAAIEDAFQWSSDSSGSVSASRSSGSGAAASAGSTYRTDVYNYAVACVSRGESDGELLRGVGRIAELNGISNWEAAPDTLTAFNAVVREGQLGEVELERLRGELAPLGPAVLAGTFEGG